MMTLEKVREVLTEIQQSVPMEWRQKVVIKKPISPTIKMVMEEAVKSDSIAAEKKEQIQRLLDAGEFSKEQYSEDPKYARKIEDFVNRHINLAIREGRLPTRKKMQELMKANEKSNNQSN